LSFGRVSTSTYPTPAGAPPFIVAQEHDAYGHVLRVSDATTGAPYWQLTRVSDAGRTRTEVLGTGTTIERTYFDAKQRVKTLTTESPATTVQSLAYDHDARLDLVCRTDVLQPQHPTERFRYDALERLTCAYFSPSAEPAAPATRATPTRPTATSPPSRTSRGSRTTTRRIPTLSPRPAGTASVTTPPATRRPAPEA
jgi:hypothetical protein